VAASALAVLLLSARLVIAPARADARHAAPTVALDSNEEFGVNTGVMFNGGHYTRVQIDAQLAALARTGATVVRSDALWEDSEPQPPVGILHRYNWTLDDLIVGSLAAHGLRWMPIIDYSTPWAKAAPGQIHSPPSSISDFAGYAAAVASRYGPGGSFWLENPGLKPLPVLTYEIWNEPDNSVFWYPTPNPATYANLYAATRNAILSNQAGAHVIIGGLTRPAWFLANMLAADPGLRGQIDGVAIHPYASTPNRVFVAVRNARLAMNSDGLVDVPLYVTEVGWTTHGARIQDSASAAQRPGYIATTISTLAHTDCGIAGVMLYAWTTAERNSSNPQDWFGISPPGAGPSADTTAFANALQAAALPAPPALLCTTNPALIDTRVLTAASPRRAVHPRVASGDRGARKPRRHCRGQSRRHRRCSRTAKRQR
jgi:polysaccharide biosynthesis protein PslG